MYKLPISEMKENYHYISTVIKRMIREYCEPHYAKKFSDLAGKDKLLESHELQKQNLNSPIMDKIFYNFSASKNPSYFKNFQFY